jgi:N-glycosylase/DNA lyase
MSELDKVQNIYDEIKSDIENRILEFKNIWKNGTELDIFYELAFCILTPQSKAVMADKAIKSIKSKDLIFTNNWEILSNELNVVRFKNNKAKYIIEARNKLSKNGNLEVKNLVDVSNLNLTRDNIVKNIKGIGYKEASHFLRNVGFGDEVAILDRHILKNMYLLGAIDEVPKTLTPKIYFDIEKSLLDFAEKIKIPAGHLDFVLWYKEAGAVFK